MICALRVRIIHWKLCVKLLICYSSGNKQCPPFVNCSAPLGHFIGLIQYIFSRGNVVKWLETPIYDAESCSKVVRSRPGFAIPPTTGKLYLPSSKWVPFSNQGRTKDGLRLSSAVPKIQWVSDPHCPCGC